MVRRTLHTIIEVNTVEGTVGSSIPVLILENGDISLLTLAWVREQKILGDLGPVSLMKSTEAVGRLYDYYTIVEKGRSFTAEQLERMLLRFVEAREFGNKELGWAPGSGNVAYEDYRYVMSFIDFCAGNFSHIPINPKELKLVVDIGIKEQQAIQSKMAIKKTWDKLYHLTPTTLEGQGKVLVRRRALRRKKQKRTTRPKHFPPQKILLLIKSVTSTRDKLFLLLIFFGGLRKSEPFHLFATDIRIKNNSAIVTLADPETGKYEWSDAFLGNQSGDRQEFLAQRYGLGPRNKFGLKHPLHAGWKYITYESDRDEATLQWLLPEIGIYFAVLHKKYMNDVRNHVRDDHPYYFVNTKEGPGFGQPMTMSNMDKIFTRAIRKIGLSTSDAGVNPHGARHFFGYFCASYLRLTQEVTQILMRHANISSTQVYYNLDIEIAKIELEKGQKILAESIPDFCQEASHLLDNDRYDH